MSEIGNLTFIHRKNKSFGFFNENEVKLKKNVSYPPDTPENR